MRRAMAHSNRRTSFSEVLLYISKSEYNGIMRSLIDLFKGNIASYKRFPILVEPPFLILYAALLLITFFTLGYRVGVYQVVNQPTSNAVTSKDTASEIGPYEKFEIYNGQASWTAGGIGYVTYLPIYKYESKTDAQWSDVTFNKVVEQKRGTAYVGKRVYWRGVIRFWGTSPEASLYIIDDEHPESSTKQAHDWFWVTPPGDERPVFPIGGSGVYGITGVLNDNDCTYYNAPEEANPNCIPDLTVESIEAVGVTDHAKLPSEFYYDEQPNTSPDGKLQTYIRRYPMYPGINVYMGNYSELRLRNLLAKDDILLVASGKKPDLSSVNEQKRPPIESFGRMYESVFSLDNKTVYFTTYAWVTSSAVFSIDLATRKLTYITDGNSLSVVQNGPYKGMLIVSKHRYYDAPNYGSYDHDYIVNLKGDELLDLGDTAY